MGWTVIVLVRDLAGPSRLVGVGVLRSADRASLLTSCPPHTPCDYYHQFTDELHDWFVSCLGAHYTREVRVVDRHGLIGFEFDRPTIYMMFKLAWVGL